MSNAGEGPAERTVLRIAIGWIALVLLDGYATWLHQGLASPPGGFASQWWHPTQFLILHPTIGGWEPGEGAFYLSLPAIALTGVVFWGSRSAIARTLALMLLITTIVMPMLAFGESPWELFHWRLSVVILVISLAIAVAIMSPALTDAWLRRGVALRLLLYVPVAFAVIALMRNATGTDETLVANVSPWPSITVFGLEMATYTIVGILFGVGIGLAALTQWEERKGFALVGVVAGCVFPAIWFHQRFQGDDPSPLVALTVVTAIVLGLSTITRWGDRGQRIGHRATIFVLGAALVITPIIAGRAWAAADYTVNKFVRARIATDALAKYFEKEGVYPDTLDVLTEQNYLEELPTPRVGFDFLYDIGFLPPIEFDYRSLGSSYVLEFNSTEWVQCAYNPPWSAGSGGSEYEDDEEYAEEYGEEYDDESGEAWSCPDTRPSLWGNDEEGGEEYVARSPARAPGSAHRRRDSSPLGSSARTRSRPPPQGGLRRGPSSRSRRRPPRGRARSRPRASGPRRCRRP